MIFMSPVKLGVCQINGFFSIFYVSVISRFTFFLHMISRKHGSETAIVILYASNKMVIALKQKV